MPVTPEQFVEVWQTSDSQAEVAERLGLTAGGAAAKASFYRKKGIPLKMMGPGRYSSPIDAEALTALAKKFAPREEK